MRPLVFQVVVRRGVDHLEEVLGVEDFTLLLLVVELLLILHQLEHHVMGVPVAVFIRVRELVRCPHHHAGLGRVLGHGRVLLAEGRHVEPAAEECLGGGSRGSQENG